MINQAAQIHDQLGVGRLPASRLKIAPDCQNVSIVKLDVEEVRGAETEGLNSVLLARIETEVRALHVQLRRAGRYSCQQGGTTTKAVIRTYTVETSFSVTVLHEHRVELLGCAVAKLYCCTIRICFLAAKQY